MWAGTSSRKIKKKLPPKLYCEFCGVEINGMARRRYCSLEHQRTANRRRIARRLGIMPRISKLNPLYFN